MNTSNRVWVHHGLTSLCAMIFLGGLLIFSFRSYAAEEEDAPGVSPGEMKVPVKIVAAKAGNLPVRLKAMGTIVPAQQAMASVVSRVAGIVSGVQVRDGQEVSSGTVLVRLDPRPMQNALNKSRAALNAAEAEYSKASNGGVQSALRDLEVAAKEADIEQRQAEKESARQSALYEDHLASEKALTMAKQSLESAQQKAQATREKLDNFKSMGRSQEIRRLQAAVDGARADLAAAELDLTYGIIRAPQAGRVSNLKIAAGQSLDANATVAQVSNSSSCNFHVQISPRDVDAIAVGAPVVLQLDSGRPAIEGSIVSVGGELDPDTGLVPVIARLAPKGQSVPRIGEAAFAEITTGKDCEGILVPVSAVTVEDDKASIFTVDEKQIAHAKPVEVLGQNSASAVIRGSGITSGTRVIAEGNYNLPDGARVLEVAAR